MRRSASLLIVLAILTNPLFAQQLDVSTWPRQNAVVDAVEKARNSVVSVETETLERGHVNPVLPFSGMGGMFFPDLIRFFRVPSLGSGVIVDTRGYVLTNYHVISGAISLRVTMASGESYDAELIGVDSNADLAIIRILAPSDVRFQPLRIGRSDNLLIGETAIVIGNNMGYQHTVTVGVVSGTDRHLKTEDNNEYIGLVQTDAAINRGNSGGPMLNINAEVIGITTIIVSRTEGSQGVGFAIPAARIRQTLDEVLNGTVCLERRLGIYPLATNPTISRSMLTSHLNHQGVAISPESDLIPERMLLVQTVQNGSLAEKAGLKQGALISSIDGQPLTGYSHWLHELQEHRGRQLVLGTLSDDGRDDQQRVRLRNGSITVDIPDQETNPVDNNQTWFGFAVQGLSGALTGQLRVPLDTGVMVTEVVEGSPAAEVGLRKGDLVRYMAPGPIDDPAGFREYPTFDLAQFRRTQQALRKANVIELIAHRDGVDYQVRMKRSSI